ncbi:MAG: hypothetical protein ACLP50_23365 [Solirubrobacteraceae bacterium]
MLDGSTFAISEARLGDDPSGVDGFDPSPVLTLVLLSFGPSPVLTLVLLGIGVGEVQAREIALRG